MKFKKRWLLALLPIIWIFCCESCFHMRMSDREAKKEFIQKQIPVEFCSWYAGDMFVHYVKTGNEKLPTLFFIHGSPGSWDAFKRYLMDSDLRRQFRVIAVDRPGFGYSNFGKAYHLDTEAKLIYKVIEHEANGLDMNLIGHSLGGPILVKIAQDHPEAFHSLTLLAGSISPYDEPIEKWRGIFVGNPLQYLVPGALRTSNTEIYYYKKDLYMMDSSYDKLNMPITFIHGNKDPLVTVKNVDYGTKKLKKNPNIKVIIIPGANHFIPWEHYDIIKKHLMSLDSLKKS